jgi:hypothetical protein
VNSIVQVAGRPAEADWGSIPEIMQAVNQIEEYAVSEKALTPCPGGGPP